MPQHVLKMLDNLIENGSSKGTQVLAEGVKASLGILVEVQNGVADCKKHVEDKDLHTPKGILLRKAVICWVLFIMIIVSTIVAHLPEKLAMLYP